MCGGKLTTGWACGSNRGVKAVVKASRRAVKAPTASLSCWIDDCVAVCVSTIRSRNSVNSSVVPSGF